MIKELFLQEHKKLWKKKSVRISFLLCVLYIVVFGSFLTYQWFTFGSSRGTYSGFGNNFDGYENIRKMKEYAKQWEGEMTDEKLQEMVRDYQALVRGAEAAHSAGDREKESLYAEQAQKKDTLTRFYARRQQKVEEYLDIFGHTEEEKEYLLQMNDRVKEPFVYHWLEGWKLYLTQMLNDFGMVMAVFIVIALSTVFAGEWHNGMGMLMLTTKNGWREVAYAKVLSGIAFTLELFFTIAAGAVAGQLIYLGTEGWDMPIQYIKLIAVAPMNMLQAEIYEYVYFLLGSVGLALLVMFFSAVARNNFIALVSGLAVVYLPMALTGYMPMQVQRVFDLIPLVGSPSDIFRTNVFHMFGQIIWSPYLLITIPVILGCAFIPFTVRRWAGRLKR